MKVDVYDTYATAQSGDVIHFDVLVPSDATANTAFTFALDWLMEIGQEAAELKQSRCNFCHQENAGGEIVDAIEKDGYYILQMEGCPNPR